MSQLAAPDPIRSGLDPDSCALLRPACTALAQSAAVQPRLRAWVHLASASSLAEPPTGPLRGWPLGVKDNLDVAGMPTRCGSEVSSPLPQTMDAACVAQLRAAGAVPIGKTVTTEYAYVTPGPTRNPWQAGYTPGGSSSGSAAAVAAGLVPIALGTQTGGSMIRPAAFCGVVGFKPSSGLVSREGMHLACESLDTIGWYGASVGHALAVARVLLPSCEGSAKRLAQLRIACLHGNPGHVLQADAQAALADAAGRLQQAGAQVLAAPAMAQADTLLQLHATLMRYEFARSLTPVIAADTEHRLSVRLRETVRAGHAIDGQAYVAARQGQARWQQCWQAQFGDADLVLTSSALGPAPVGLAHTGDSAFNKGWSVLGWPCLHLPTCWSDSGLPLGVLLVARPYADLDLLEWAQQIHTCIDVRERTRPVFSPLSMRSET